MPAEERQALEEAGQEKIEFISERTSRSGQVHTEILADEKIQKEVSLDQVQEDVQNKKGEQEFIIQTSEQQKDEVRSVIQENISESEDHSNGEPQNGEMSLTTEKNIQDDDQSTSEAEKPQPQKRWKVWREKIQGFIKKLFA